MYNVPTSSVKNISVGLSVAYKILINVRCFPKKQISPQDEDDVMATLLKYEQAGAANLSTRDAPETDGPDIQIR